MPTRAHNMQLIDAAALRHLVETQMRCARCNSRCSRYGDASGARMAHAVAASVFGGIQHQREFPGATPALSPGVVCEFGPVPPRKFERRFPERLGIGGHRVINCVGEFAEGHRTGETRNLPGRRVRRVLA